MCVCVSERQRERERERERERHQAIGGGERAAFFVTLEFLTPPLQD